MASIENSEMDEDQLCCIEATVVSGFEECARGEAREKFKADVKAVRGKITWNVPIENVTEVVKMGSIDNCKVVMKSVPNFGFIPDEHDSLARLQKLVADLDWDKGLRVWNKFNEFPHPIMSKSDTVTSPEELVEVVVIDPKTRSKDVKSKKGGRAKKKEKIEAKKKEKMRAGGDRANEKDSISENGVVKDDNVSSEKLCDRLAKTSFDENGTKKVIIKQLDPNEPPPKIEIRVLIPGPDESVFPTDINDKDQRDVEPMDVDLSMQQNPDDSASSPAKQAADTTPDSDKKDEDSKETVILSESKSPPASPFKHPSSAAINILSSAKDFASSVIERLTSSQSVPEEVSDLSASPSSCVTPPPTPVQHGLDFFMKSRQENSVKSSSVDDDDAATSAERKDGNNAGESEADSLETSKSPATEMSTKQTEFASESVHDKSDENSNPPSKEDTVKEDAVDTKAVAAPVKVKVRDPTKPSFRVTCNRVGDYHRFDSSSAAACFGSAIVRYFNWSVDLKKFDIEVLLNIDNEEVGVSLAITKTSLHNRNLVAFGPTTLRATICYNMLRLCRIKKGDFVCDPMCGTSAIPIEGSLNWPNCFFISGDHHEKGISRSGENVAGVRQNRQKENKDSLKLDTVQWDIENFPLRDNCVDVFVSDLPFGHRMGSRCMNRTLYPSLLNAMARTARPGARACLLTGDRTSLVKAVQFLQKFWQRRVILNINMGGLSGYVFLLTRTTAPYDFPPEVWKNPTEGARGPSRNSGGPPAHGGNKGLVESTPEEESNKDDGTEPEPSKEESLAESNKDIGGTEESLGSTECLSEKDESTEEPEPNKEESLAEGVKVKDGEEALVEDQSSQKET